MKIVWIMKKKKRFVFQLWQMSKIYIIHHETMTRQANPGRDKQKYRWRALREYQRKRESVDVMKTILLASASILNSNQSVQLTPTNGQNRNLSFCIKMELPHIACGWFGSHEQKPVLMYIFLPLLFPRPELWLHDSTSLIERKKSLLSNKAY